MVPVTEKRSKLAVHEIPGKFQSLRNSLTFSPSVEGFNALDVWLVFMWSQKNHLFQVSCYIIKAIQQHYRNLLTGERKFARLEVSTRSNSNMQHSSPL